MRCTFCRMDEKCIISLACSSFQKSITKTKNDRYLTFSMMNIWRQMDTSLSVSLARMLGKVVELCLETASRRFRFSSEFVSTKIIHDLYQLCCEKRFKGNVVKTLVQPPRITLYKYLVIPKEGPQPNPPETRPPSSALDPPRTPTEETRPSVNPFESRGPHRSSRTDQQAPPEVKRRISYNNNTNNTTDTGRQQRSRSGTLPFVENLEPLQHISSMRSGNGSVPARHVQSLPESDEQDEQ